MVQLCPCISGVYFVKLSDDYRWKRYFVHLKGQFIRIFKRQLPDDLIETDMKTEELINEKFYQLRLQEYILTECSCDEIDEALFRCHSVVKAIGKGADGSEHVWRIAMFSEECCEQWIEGLTESVRYISSLQGDNNYEELRLLAVRMMSEIPLRVRYHHFHRYSQCFLGRDAVDWLKKNRRLTSVDAVKLGNDLLNFDFIHHIKHKRFLCNSELLYQFNVSAILRVSNEVSGGFPEHTTLIDIEKNLRNNTQDVSNLLTENERLRRSISDLHHEVHSARTAVRIVLVLLSVFVLIPVIWILMEHMSNAFSMSFSHSVKNAFVCIVCITEVRQQYLTRSLIDFLDAYTSLFSMPMHTRGSMSNDRSDRIKERGGISSITSAQLGTAMDCSSHVPDPTTWPSRPLLTRRSPHMYRGRSEAEVSRLIQPLRLHTQDPRLSVIPVESDMFVGEIYILVDGLADSPKEFFSGKKRVFEAVVQGRFKRTIAFSEVYTGQIYSHAFSSLPPQWIVRWIQRILRSMQPAVRINLEGDHPYLVSPLVSTAKAIVVTEPGNEPSITENIGHIVEDMSLVDREVFSGLSSSSRTSLLSKRKELAKYTYDPKLVYTFDFYQHVLNLGTMMINLGFTSLDAYKFIGQSPIQTMAVVWNPVDDGIVNTDSMNFLYYIEMWHERILQHREDDANELYGA